MTFREIIGRTAEGVRAEIELARDQNKNSKQWASLPATLSVSINDKMLDAIAEEFSKKIKQGCDKPSLAGAVCNSILRLYPIGLSNCKPNSPELTSVNAILARDVMLKNVLCRLRLRA